MLIRESVRTKELLTLTLTSLGFKRELEWKKKGFLEKTIKMED